MVSRTQFGLVCLLVALIATAPAQAAGCDQACARALGSICCVKADAGMHMGSGHCDGPMRDASGSKRLATGRAGATACDRFPGLAVEKGFARDVQAPGVEWVVVETRALTAPGLRVRLSLGQGPPPWAGWDGAGLGNLRV